MNIQSDLANSLQQRVDETSKRQSMAGQLTDRKGETIGDQLNRMSGIQTEKNIWEQKKGEMGKEAFLKMFLEQLKYQDPMNPVKNEQFSQQMAMFSQLEQQINTNKHLEKMISQQSNMQIAALQLVGKEITADRSVIYHDKTKHSALNIKVPQDVNELKVEILDGVGEVVRTYQMGAHEKGDLAFKWDGNKDTGQPVESGRYSYRVSGKDLEGKPVTVNTRVDGKVTGVTSNQGAVFLMVGEQKIGLSDVEMIKEAQTTSNNQNVNGVSTVPAAAQGAQKLAKGEIPSGTNLESNNQQETEKESFDKGEILRSQKSLLDRFDPFNSF
jgi:flagellar basal-body rod modification protein FlgD